MGQGLELDTHTHPRRYNLTYRPIYTPHSLVSMVEERVPSPSTFHHSRHNPCHYLRQTTPTMLPTIIIQMTMMTMMKRWQPHSELSNVLSVSNSWTSLRDVGLVMQDSVLSVLDKLLHFISHPSIKSYHPLLPTRLTIQTIQIIQTTQTIQSTMITTTTTTVITTLLPPLRQ